MLHRSLSRFSSQRRSFASTVTKLANGVKVSSIGPDLAVPRVGIVIGGGSRFETRDTTGVSYILENSAYQGNSTNRHLTSHLKLLEHIGVQNFSVKRDRETITYSADVIKENVGDALEVLTSIVETPRLEKWHLEDVFHILETVSKQYTQCQIISDALHREAFRNQPLGRPLFPSIENIEKNDLESLDTFRQASSNSIVVVGSGIEHSSLASSAEAAFSLCEKSALSKNKPQVEQSKYVGGEVRIPGDNSTLRVALGFEGEAFGNNKKYGALWLLSALVGDYCKTATNRAETYGELRKFGASNTDLHWARSCVSGYSDTGLFIVNAQTSSSSKSSAIHTSLLELLRKIELSDASLAMAKNIFLTKFLHLIDNTGAFPLLSQSTYLSSPFTPQEFADTIRDISLADLQAAAKKTFSSSPTLVAHGDVEGLVKL